MSKAIKDNSSINDLDNIESNETKEFNELISNWSESSKRLLLILNQKKEITTKNKNSKSLMALGAMGAYINMALQALKSAELDHS